jgi:hypothetical protein
LLVAMAIVAVRVAPFLTPGTLPARGDPQLPFKGSDLTPQFAPFVKIASDALWKQGTIAFWNPFELSGSPLFESPQAGVVSLSTVLGGPLGWIAAVKMSMIIHLFVGMIGVFVLARWLRARAIFAAGSALMFAVGGFLTGHFRVGHLNLFYPMTLMPWTLFAFARALDGKSNGIYFGLGSGALIAAQILEGGDTVILYECLAMGLAIPIAFAVSGWQDGKRAVLALVIAGATAFALSAFQLLPMISYMHLSGRAQGIPLGRAMQPISEVTQAFPNAMTLFLGAVGVAGLWRMRRRDAVWLATIVVFSLAVAASPFVYSILWHLLPGFRYQRIPQRALVLAAVCAPVLAACGLETFWTAISHRALRVGVTIGLALALVLAAWPDSPALPPMASNARELAANSAMQWVAAHANGARMHIAESVDRNWGTEHVTVPLGLEVIAGYTPADHGDYLPDEVSWKDRRTFLEESYHNPATLWGMLNVRFVLSTRPISVSGLRLATVVPSCPVEICQPRKSSGPYIYENERLLPRSWIVEHAVGLVGARQANLEAALDVMTQNWFHPARLVILQLPPGAHLPPVDLAFSTGSTRSSMHRWNSEALAQVRKLSDEANSQGKPNPVWSATFSRPDLNRIRITAASSGWLVISERIGLFPGWKASTGNASVAIQTANGVLGAIYLKAPADIELRYRPPFFGAGLAVLACCLVLVLLLVGVRIASKPQFR